MQLAEKVLNQYFEVSKTELGEFIKLAKPGIELGLDTIIFGVKNHRLTLQVSNRRTSVQKNFGAFGFEEQFPVSVTYKEVAEMVGSLDAERVAIHWDNGRIYFDTLSMRETSYASTECQLRVHPSIEMLKFPSLPILEAMPAILKVIDENAARSYGTVCHLSVGTFSFSFVGTDGFRLVYSHFPLPESYGKRFDGLTIFESQCKQLLLAAKSKQELSLGVSEDKTTMALHFGEYSVLFRTSGINYPQYESILPKISSGKHFEVKSLLARAKLALKSTCEKRIFRLAAENGLLVVSSRPDEKDPHWHRYTTSVPCGFSPMEELFLNGQFLVDCLSATKAKEGMLCIQDDKKEAIKVILGSVDTILMPIRGEK